ncbi:hypothetical protein A9Y57_00120 [Streptococcus parauberis]|uniref:HTH cro/C1-type domain-containing protein n=1 Tax=Streptococcus parauberis TaxID=1348 RepID=A0A854WQ04_9STRE|nr:helix-turn-helix transcriptional regulator [Streptococcus parauberis]PCH13852.1 hypothetical protein A9Y57_00486 [Streptococcus parauberis]PCH14118.1 hypothetical protein A9Y57_00120 [Streptococcus parauberis]
MIYDKIRALASRKNVSIYRIEKDLELSNGSIRKWNDSKPSVSTMKKVADYLGASIDDLL